MIYTVTLNPSLDYIVDVDSFVLGKTNRTNYERMLPGGKGINVSTVLSNLGFKTTALGIVAGFTGQEINTQLRKMGIATDFVVLKEGNSRINIKCRFHEGTEINGEGPEISQKDLAKLLKKLETIKDGDVLVIAGSIPKGVSGNVYQEMIKMVEQKDVLLVVDTTKQLLLDTLPYQPFLVKPNLDELGEIFERQLHTEEDIVDCGKRLQQMGAKNVLVSMGAEGAILIAEDGQIYTSKVPKGKLINAVGAGDSMVAGFLAGWFRFNHYEEALFAGIAAGSASAYSEFLASKEDVGVFYHLVKRTMKKMGEATL